MDDYISKPVNVTAIRSVLEKFLKTKSGTNQPSNEVESGNEVSLFNRLEFMDRMMGDEEIARTIIQVFLEDLPVQMNLLKSHLSSGDLPNAEQVLHTIKGSSSNLGGERLSNSAHSMEMKAKLGDLPGVLGALPELEEHANELTNVLTEELKDLSGS
jgi:HPt (histidine-containing phosphotransfer) domain-containing protein